MTPATLRSVWFSITTATEDPPGLPVPIGHNFDELPDRAPIASLSFRTADEALQWAIWVDHEHTSRWSDNGTVTFIGDRMGWRWLLSCHKPSKRSLISSSREVDGSERLLVPCGRCGHKEEGHFGRGPARRGCGACPTGNCEPVLVPVGVAATTTIVDAEDEVE